jgi:LPS sulfotransferase NodH
MLTGGETAMGVEPAIGGFEAEQPIRTLIDERLDFKRPTPLRKSYIVASSYRSGSSFLCTALWETGLLGAPWEYVNTDHELHNLKARFNVSEFADYLPKLLARRTSRNGVFGMKAHFHHFRAALDEYPRLLEDLNPVTFIYINRRDKLAQAVSMAIARQTKSWISLQRARGSEPEYDKDYICDALETAERQTRAWQNWFKRRNIVPFVVDYEDVIADKAGVVRSIVELLGVQDDEPEAIILPPVNKQGDETNEAWIARFKSETETDGVAAFRSQTRAAARGPSSSELMDLGWIAFIYGFPCYELARLRYRALKNPFQGRPSSLNTWRHARRLRTPQTSLVTAANSDTLHSGAWLDLSGEPLILRLPDSTNRYYSLQLMDFFTNNFAVLGRGTVDTAGREFVVAGPTWDRDVPAGMTLIRATSNSAWALIRVLVEGPDDLSAAHALQDQFTISPFSNATFKEVSSIDPLSLPVLPLENADPLKFFDVLNAVLTENPPPERDQEILDRLRLIGVGPSLSFDRGAFTATQLEDLREGIASGQDTLRAKVRGERTRGRRHRLGDELLSLMRGPSDFADDQLRGPQRIGWSRPFKEAGDFGINYLLRARYALVSIGVLPREEAMYFRTVTDATGHRLDGTNHYVLRFPPGGLPPVNAFWSLTVYQADESKRRWLVPNEINRYSIGDRTPGLRYGTDGALEILIQHDRPSANIENWLPVCKGPFSVTLRTYRPRRELLDERYMIPAIERR